MPARSVADATRFTPTGPHAFTQSPSPASTSGESPQARVARLREAARKQKQSTQSLSRFDRIIDSGRVWADRMHKVTAMGLIGATILAGSITVYAVVDMMAFNRARRREFVRSQFLLSTQIKANVRCRKQPPKLKKEKEVLTSAMNAPTAPTTTATSSIPATAPTPAMEERPGAIDKLKKWAVSGLTPADQEYKDPVARAEDEARRAARIARVEEEANAKDVTKPGNDLVKGGGEGGCVGKYYGVVEWAVDNEGDEEEMG